VQGYGFAAATALSAHERSGRDAAFLQIANWINYEPDRGMEIHRIIDLETGATIAATKLDSSKVGQYAKCGASSYTVTSAFQSLVAVYGKGGNPTKVLYGGFDAHRTKWTWQLPGRDWYAPAGGETSYLEPGGGGQWFSITGQRPVVRALLTPGSSVMTPIVEESRDWIPRIFASYGNLVAWSETGTSSPGSRIRGYGVEDGRALRTVLDHLPGDVCALSMSHSHLAGTLGNGPSCNLYQEDSRLWAVRRDAGAAGAASLSPVLFDGWVTYFNSTTNGRFVAVTMADDERGWAFLLARIQDWNIRYIPNDWPAWLAMDSKYLYTMATRRDKYRGRVKEVRRYDLEGFDGIGAPYEGVLLDADVLCDLYPCHGEDW